MDVAVPLNGHCLGPLSMLARGVSADYDANDFSGSKDHCPGFLGGLSSFANGSCSCAALSGLQPLGSTVNVPQTLTFSPSGYTARIPQFPLPLGMNFWCFKTTPASDQEIAIGDFQYVAASGMTENHK
jgi:hypothetical protein